MMPAVALAVLTSPLIVIAAVARTIRVSQPVWEAISKRGRFGESADDVLRRVLRIDTGPRPVGKMRKREASYRMTAKIESSQLLVQFASGPSRTWPLPSKSDKSGIRSTRDEAVAFAQANGATLGQVNAVKKALTANGYHINK